MLIYREAAERGSAAIQRWGRDGGGAEPLIPFFLPVFSSPLLDAEGFLPLYMGSIRELLQIFLGCFEGF